MPVKDCTCQGCKAARRVLPMPNQKYRGCTIVASCANVIDGSDEFSYTLLLLTNTPGSYYEVVTITDGKEVGDKYRFPNIVPATAAYLELTGCY